MQQAEIQGRLGPSHEGSDNPHRVPLFAGRIHIGPYWLAVLSALLGVLLRFLIDPWLGDQMPYMTFLVSVALTGLYAGVRPALLCTALGAGLAYFCFVPPRYHWGFAGISDAAGFMEYLTAALGMVLLAQAKNNALETTARHLKERINAERNLRDAQKLLQMFMNNLPGWAYLRDHAGRYMYYNDEARLLLGVVDGSASVPSESRFKLESRDRQAPAATQGAMQFVDKMIVRGDEQYLLTTKFIFTDGEKQSFVGSLSIDITSQMQAEQVVLETERLAAAGQMLSMVAHEINNPLAAMTNLFFLLGREALPHRAQELISIAQNQVARLTHITKLAIGLYTQTEIPVAVYPCRLVDDVLMQLTAKYSVKRVRFQRDYRWEGVLVICAGQIRQIIENIILNSLEAGAGQIRVRVARANDWRMFSRSGLRISILDDGRGMNSQQRETAFEPFFSTKTEKGTGLGLWVAKAIALRNGGHITLRSTDGPGRHGTFVSVFLPDRIAAGPATSPTPNIELE